MIAKSLFDKNDAKNKKDLEEIAQLTETIKNLKDLSLKKPPTSSDEEKCLGMSKALEVKYTSDQGRFVTAKKDVAPGEVLVEEKAYASCLDPKRFGINCQKCMVRLKVVVPCETCSGVAFCSVKCRQEATFHQFECRYMDVLTGKFNLFPLKIIRTILFFLGFGCSLIARLALRMLTQKSYNYFANLRKSLSDVQLEKEVCNSDSYIQVYNLVDNNDQRWPEDDLWRGIMALILMKVLKKCEFLPENANKGEEFFVASLLLRHLQILQFNAHEVYEVLRQNKNCVKPCKNQPVGLAIYPKASYFNHSCHGGVARSFEGDKLTVKALRKINKGSQVFENYGPTFYFKGRAERQEELKLRYWFQCGCEACKNDWPLLEKLPKMKEAERLKVMEKFAKGQQAMDCGDVETAGKRLTECLEEEVCQVEGLPKEEVVRMEDKLRTCVSNQGRIVFVEAAKKENIK